MQANLTILRPVFTISVIVITYRLLRDSQLLTQSATVPIGLPTVMVIL